MRVLFVHQSFPGQYRHLATALAALPGYEVIGLGEQDLDLLPGVQHVRYPAPEGAGSATHRYLHPMEAAVRRGQAVARAGEALKARGFRPDLVCCHPGWGEGLFLRDVFPDARLLYDFEYHYAARGADLGFGEDGPATLDEAARIRILNANNLLNLDTADWGHTATHWQRSRFPNWAQARMTVQHEGVDTDLARRDPAARFVLPDGRVLTAADEVITYAARGLEPYRGFPTFMRSLPNILRHRPHAQVVVVGSDTAHYGPGPDGGGSWRDTLQAELGDRLDGARVHFVGPVHHRELLSLFSLSAAHVYLTRPFILSWSLLEAMSCACPIIASATPPVEELVSHGRNGRLVDFHAPDELSAGVVATLEQPGCAREWGLAARADIVGGYDLKRICLPAGLKLLHAVAQSASRGLRSSD